MKKMIKRLLSAAMAASLAATVFAGCQSNETTSSGTVSGGSSESGDSSKIVTIQYYGGGGNPQKYYEWQQEYFEEKIGVRVEALVKDKEQLQPMVAAGNLPDMGHYTNDGDPTQLIKGGHVADLTEYESLMPNYVQEWPASVQYVKDFKSDGTGKLYEVLLQVGSYDNYPMDVGCYAANIRWDIYEKAGRPEVTDMYSYLDALKKMQEIYPKTEEGLPTYGMSLFPEWDSTEMSCYKKYTTVTGTLESNIGYNVYSILEDKVYPMIEKDSPYYDALKWLNTANRMGLIDPDSTTQTYTVANAKVAESGQALSSMWGSYCSGYNTTENVAAEDPRGYMPLIWEGQHPCVQDDTVIGNVNDPLFISSTVSKEKQEACAKFINLMFDEDICMAMYSGPQGELWDIVDGKYQLVTENVDKIRETNEYTFSSGETCSNWWMQWGLRDATFHSKYDVPLAYARTEEYTKSTLENNKIAEMWSEVYGKERPIEVWRENDALCFNPEWKNFIEVMPDNLTEIQNNVKGVITTLSWQAVMEAKSDEEFDALFDRMVSQCNDLGIQEIVTWGQEQITKAQESIGKYEDMAK